MGIEDNFKGATGQRFSSTNQPKNSGRKKNVFKKFQEKYELSSDDVNTLIEYLLSLSGEKLMKIVKDNKQSALVMNMASAVLHGIKKGDLTAVERLLDRKIGKPKDVVEIKGNISTSKYNLDRLSDEQLQQLENLLTGAAESEPSDSRK